MALNAFVPRGPNIFLYTPPNHDIGRLVVLCTWLGASDKHVAKYVDIYLEHAPRTQILLLRSAVFSIVTSYSRQQRCMRPAEDVLFNFLDETAKLQPAKSPRIILHVMSNGGVNSAANLMVDLNKRAKIQLPIVGIICDSTPNASSYQKTVQAFWHSFPNQAFPFNIIVAIFIHVTISLLYMSIAMGRYEAPEDYWRKSILDEKLVPCKRICYFASKADKQIDWKDVVSHGYEARAKGWEVYQHIFDDTPHCNHISKFRKVYVTEVKTMLKVLNLEL